MTPLTPPSPSGNKSSHALLIVVLVVGGLGMCCVIGTLAAIAVPNFLKFQARSKQSEAKTNLKAAYIAERSYLLEHDQYSELIEDLEFRPPPRNRYRYFFSLDGDAQLASASPGGKHTGVLVDPAFPVEDGVLKAAMPLELVREVGIRGDCPTSCRVTVVAIGNIDNDATFDVWSVSTEERTIGDLTAAAGMPFHHVDDSRE